MTKPCCNQDCCQGRQCPLPRRHAWWAEILVVAMYFLVAICTVALVVYGGAKLSGYLLTLSPIVK